MRDYGDQNTLKGAVLFMNAPAIYKTSWGMVDGEAVDLYTFSNSALTVSITNFGAHIVSIEAPDRNGVRANVVLGFKNLDGYLGDAKTYMGAIVGRYGNRIANGRFSLDGNVYSVPVNNNGQALHGGTVGFDRKVWSASVVPNGVELSLISPDGDMGFPGKLTVHVRYTLESSKLQIEYTATTDKPTIENLTNHSYFNLACRSGGTVLDHELMLNADCYTPIDVVMIPTGVLAPVSGTPLDFRQSHRIGERIQSKDEQLKLAGGYDHNFVLNGEGLRLAAKAFDSLSGRTLTVTTTEPGVQFYSGNFLDGSVIDSDGRPYEKYAGFCLETQHFPNSPNEAEFPSTILRPGQMLHSTTIFEFGVQE
jgi:aldose 1-epimerase